MTKEAIKAVRLVCGYTTDLRVKLPVNLQKSTVYEENIQSLLFDRLVSIFGSNIYNQIGICTNPQPGKNADDYMKLLQFVGNAAQDVCLGRWED